VQTSKVVGAIGSNSDRTETHVFVWNVGSNMFYAVGYTSSYNSYEEIFDMYTDVKPIYEGQSVTLEF
jgi:hypothetical protein